MMRRMIERVMSLGAGLLTPPLQRPQVSRSRLRDWQARQGDLRSSQVRGQETRAQQGIVLGCLLGEWGLRRTKGLP
jgi:hypothetical protein